MRAATGFGLLALEMDEFIDHYQRASDKAVSRSARATAGDEQESGSSKRLGRRRQARRTPRWRVVLQSRSRCWSLWG